MTRSSRRVPLAAAVAVAAALVLAASALAVAPVPGAKYSGHLNSDPSTKLSFAVSKDGKFLVEMRVSTRPPNHCNLRGAPLVQSSPQARIKSGGFTALVTYKDVGGAVVGTAKVTGQFEKGGKASGLIDSSVGTSASCGGYWPFSAAKS